MTFQSFFLQTNWPENMGPRREQLVFNSGLPIRMLLSMESVKLRFPAVPARNASDISG